MKITKKGVFLTVFILLLGGFLILAPSYTFVAVKNMMTAHENREEALKEDHWVYNQTGRRYVYHDGSVIQNDSKVLDNVTYYFDEKAYVRTGWVQDNGKLFYRSPDGSPVSGWFEDENGKYYLEKDGSPKIGWADIDKKKYYFQSNGAMATGMMEIE